MQINSVLAKQKKNRITILLLAIGTLILTLMSLFVGQYGMPFIDTIKSVLGIAKEQDATVIRSIILNIRLPRTLAAIVIGGSLAVAGLTYQCVFRNNLASQDILGVSTSSCVGAALGIVLGLTTAHIQILAFAMGILNVVLVFLLASRVKLDKTLSLILSGILIGGVMSSVLAFIKYIANPQTQLQAIVFWTMGDISSITYDQLLFVAIPIIASLVILFLKRWGLNYFCYNDSEAKSLGVNIVRDRIIYLGCATVLVASSVSIKQEIEDLKAAATNVERFVDIANKYTDLRELTPEVLRTFIERIIIHERTAKHSKTATQQIDIYFRYIGKLAPEAVA